MSSIRLTSNNKKASTKQMSVKPALATTSKSPRNSLYAATLIQKARYYPSLLTKRDVIQLQQLAGNRTVCKLREGVSLAAGTLTVQRQGGLLDSVQRILRIWKRQLDRKALPATVYRIDERAPEVIRSVGFQPWKPEGDISIKEHVTGMLDQASSSGSTLAKPESQFVSTAAYEGLADVARFAMGKKLYKIDTAFEGLGRANFTDVNDYFDRRGIPRPYPRQREWIKQGGIPGGAVTHFIEAEDFYNQAKVVDGKLELPTEDEITGWKEMPPHPGLAALAERVESYKQAHQPAV